MTCRIDETLRATGEKRAQRGIELYRFRDGKLALKDVYRKPIAWSEPSHVLAAVDVDLGAVHVGLVSVHST